MDPRPFKRAEPLAGETFVFVLALQVLQQLLCEQKETKRAPNDEAKSVAVAAEFPQAQNMSVEEWGLTTLFLLQSSLSG